MLRRGKAFFLISYLVESLKAVKTFEEVDRRDATRLRIVAFSSNSSNEQRSKKMEKKNENSSTQKFINRVSSVSLQRTLNQYQRTLQYQFPDDCNGSIIASITRHWNFQSSFRQSVKQNLLCNQRCTINLLIPVNFRKNSLARKYSRVYIYIYNLY